MGGTEITDYLQGKSKGVRRCLHERLKAAGTGTAGPERLTTAKEPRRRPTDKEER